MKKHNISKIFLASFLLCNMNYALAENEDPYALPAYDSNSTFETSQSTEYQQDFSSSFSDVENLSNYEVKDNKEEIKIKITNKNVPVYEEQENVFEGILNLAKQNKHKLYWLIKDRGVLTHKVDFSEQMDWKFKIAKYVDEYNKATFRSAARGTKVNAYICDENKIIVGEVQKIIQLKKMKNIENCKVMLPTEKNKVYVNDREVKEGEEIKDVVEQIIKEENEKQKENK